MRIIRLLSSVGLIAGTVETAAGPALLAATSPDARGLYASLEGDGDGGRVWVRSEELSGVAYPGR